MKDTQEIDSLLSELGRVRQALASKEEEFHALLEEARRTAQEKAEKELEELRQGETCSQCCSSTES